MQIYWLTSLQIIFLIQTLMPCIHPMDDEFQHFHTHASHTLTCSLFQWSQLFHTKNFLPDSKQTQLIGMDWLLTEVESEIIVERNKKKKKKNTE